MASEAERRPIVKEKIGFGPAPALSRLKELDEIRERHAIYWSDYEKDQGFWVITRLEELKEAARDSTTFSNGAGIVPTESNPPYQLLPTMIDPPELVRYRQPLNRWFSPSMVDVWRPKIIEVARQLVATLIPLGGCEFIEEFAISYTAQVFLISAGLPPESDVEFFVSIIKEFTTAQASLDGAERSAAAFQELWSYWDDVLRQREKAPLDPTTDFATYLLQQRSDDQSPFSPEDLRTLLFTVTAGSLDTIKSQLAWAVYHFGANPRDRRRLVDDPSLVSSAVEEVLRFYSIIGMGRKVTRDIDFHGCPMKSGDMLLLNYPSACRDPRVFDRADEFVIDRTPNQHVGFGNSAHRCVGSHLARVDLQVALEEWHRAIPEYSIESEDSIFAEGWQSNLTRLPLVWDVVR